MEVYWFVSTLSEIYVFCICIIVIVLEFQKFISWYYLTYKEEYNISLHSRFKWNHLNCFKELN